MNVYRKIIFNKWIAISSWLLKQFSAERWSQFQRTLSMDWPPSSRLNYLLIIGSLCLFFLCSLLCLCLCVHFTYFLIQRHQHCHCLWLEQDRSGASVQHQGTATVQTDRNLCWGGSRCAEVSLSWWWCLIFFFHLLITRQWWGGGGLRFAKVSWW